VRERADKLVCAHGLPFNIVGEERESRGAGKVKASVSLSLSSL